MRVPIAVICGKGVVRRKTTPNMKSGNDGSPLTLAANRLDSAAAHKPLDALRLLARCVAATVCW